MRERKRGRRETGCGKGRETGDRRKNREQRERGTEREGEREIEPGRRGAVLPVAGYRSPRNDMRRLMYCSLWPAATALRR